MDYKAAGAPKISKAAPKNKNDRTKNRDDGTSMGRASKADLLARMKAASATDKADK